MTTILVAPDKFRGSLSAAEAAAAMRLGVEDAVPGATVFEMPIADGGEGTIEALASAGARTRRLVVDGPLGAPTVVTLASWGDSVFVESAQSLRSAPDDGDDPSRALRASSYGVGEMMASGLSDAGSRVVVGLGGTSSTDGGYGIAHALGFAVLDRRGRRLDRDNRSMAAAWDVVGDFAGHVVAATDVDSPLLGPGGAAAVFAPQKGASPEQVLELERRLRIWSLALERSFGVDVATLPGGGAAGGIAAGLAALTGAGIRSGGQIVLDMLGVPARIREADLVLTGEGSLDRQTLSGKGPAIVARLARDAGVPVFAVAGVADIAAVSSSFDAVRQISAAARPDEDSFADAAAILRREVRAVVGEWAAGRFPRHGSVSAG
jgi:glycerate kinase